VARHAIRENFRKNRRPMTWRIWAATAWAVVFVGACSGGASGGLERTTVPQDRDLRGTPTATAVPNGPAHLAWTHSTAGMLDHPPLPVGVWSCGTSDGPLAVDIDSGRRWQYGEAGTAGRAYASDEQCSSG
jgi:hypothetical protein